MLFGSDGNKQCPESSHVLDLIQVDLWLLFWFGLHEKAESVQEQSSVARRVQFDMLEPEPLQRSETCKEEKEKLINFEIEREEIMAHQSQIPSFAVS